MCRGTELQRNPTELDSLIEVREDNLLLESDSKSDSEIVKRHESIKMARRAELERSTMELNILIEVREDALLLKSGMKAIGKVIESCGSM